MPWSVWLRIIIIIVVIIVAWIVGTSVDLICVAVVVITSAEVEQSIICVGQICVNGLLTFTLMFGRRSGWCCSCASWGGVGRRRCRSWWVRRSTVTWRKFRRLGCEWWVEVGRWTRHVRWVEGILLLILMWSDGGSTWISLITLWWIVWLICVGPVWCGDSTCWWFHAQFTLCHKTLQMWHQPKSQWVLNVHAFYCHQVTSDFRSTLSEADDVIIHCKTLWIESNRIDS